MVSLGEIKAEVQAKRGTGIPALGARHAGQVACTLAG